MLSYTQLNSDPGFNCAVDEAETFQLLLGRSDIEALRGRACQAVFGVGDSIPVFVKQGNGKEFGILELIENLGDRQFQCRLTTESELPDAGSSLGLDRELKVRLLDKETGLLIVKSYVREFGSIVLEDIRGIGTN